MAIEPEIRLLKTAEEREYCAGMMSETDPWKFLSIGYDQLIELFSDSSFESYILYMGKEMAGCAVLQMQGAFVGYIKSIAITPCWQGHHLGHIMMDFLERRIFKAFPNVFLCVSSFNLKAREFYIKMGYEKVGELKDYLVKGQSEILMRKTRGPLLE